MDRRQDTLYLGGMVSLAEQPPSEGPQTIAVLVHGTKLELFTSKAVPWTDPTSDFSRHLIESMPNLQVDSCFTWSGKNTHQARLAAAEELALYLEKLHADKPDAKIVVVAHSHGGNVAEYAVARIPNPDYIAELVCMNTPFIRCRKRSVGYFVATLGAFLLIGSWASLIFLHAAIYALLWFAAIGTIAILQKPTISYLEYLQAYTFCSLQPLPPPFRVLSIGYRKGSRGDEVDSWLSRVRSLADAPFKCWNFVTKFGPIAIIPFAVAMPLAIIAFVITEVNGGYVSASSMQGAIVGLLLLAWGAFGALIPLTIILGSICLTLILVLFFTLSPALHGHSFGFGDTVAQNLLLDIGTEPVQVCPDSDRFEEYFYGDVRFGYRHFGYLIEAVKTKIAADILRTLASAKPESRTVREVSVPSSPRAGALNEGQRFLDLIRPQVPKLLAVYGAVLAIGLAGVIFGRFNLPNSGKVAKHIEFKRSRFMTERARETIDGRVAGFQSYLEGSGYTAAWPLVSFSVVDEIPKDLPDTPGTGPQWSLAGNTVTLTALTVSDTSEELRAYLQLEFSRGIEEPIEPVTIGLSEFFPWCFLGSKPKGNEDAKWVGESLAQALWIARTRADGHVEKAAMSAYMSTLHQRNLPNYSNIFVGKLMELLGDDNSDARVEFTRRGLLTQ